MSELRAEALNLVSTMPEEYLLEIVQYAKKFFNPGKTAFGMLSKYADKNLIEKEKFALESEVTKNYGKNFD